jgi:thiamine transport system ATP-binding protein
MDKSGLVCSQLSVNYPEFNLYLDLEIGLGELVSIIGPSGSGKSTTLQLITGLIPNESGSISLNGKEITHMPVWERNIGMVFQDYALFPHLNVAQNIAYSLRFKKLSRSERKQRVNELLQLVGLTGYEKRKINELSGGERQRIALARSLASSPTLLLLDEPLSALDAKMRKYLRQQLRRIHEATGITTLYVTHDQEEALSISDRVIVMHNGKMEQFDTPENIYNHPKTLFAARFMGEGTLLPLEMAKEHFVLTSGQTKSNLDEDLHLFFRPEKVTVHQNPSLSVAQFLDHFRFDDVKLIGYEYLGGRYLLNCEWEGHTILAYCDSLCDNESFSLTVRINDVTFYNKEGIEAKLN